MTGMMTAIDDTPTRTSGASAGTPMVFVVDTDLSVRESLEVLIDVAGWRVETFASPDEFLARPRATVPSCLLLDLSIRDLHGLDRQQRIAADRPDMPIIVISANCNVRMTVQAMKAGAIELLTKPFDEEMLLNAIQQALDRSRRSREQLARMAQLRESYALLTPREREVMTLVASGLLNKQVGGELGISEITVKAHRGQVMRKMKAASLPALVNMVARLGLETAQAAW
jgi:FixJ family two-component response regulator